MFKKFAFLALLVALAGGAAWWYLDARPEEDDSRLVLYGNVDIRDVVLGFRVAGRIAFMPFEEGDRVRAGERVAALDSQPYADVAAVRRAQLAQARAVYGNTVNLFNRRAGLVKSGAVSREEYDEAEASRDEAAAGLETAQAQLRQAETDLADTEIYAPSAGVILVRVQEPGGIVGAGGAVYTLALDEPVWVRTYVAEPDLGSVYPGQRAVVLTDSGAEYAGQVGFISPQAEFTPKTVETAQLRTDLVYRLRVIVDAPDTGLRQGMPVTVHIRKERGHERTGSSD